MAVLTLICNLIDNIIINLLTLIGIKNRILLDADMNYINVKYGSLNSTVVLRIKPEMTVQDIKKQLVSKIDINLWSDIAIIFLGKELPNDLRLNECDLGQNSVIHAVKVKTKNPKTPLSFTPLLINEKLTNIHIDDNETHDSSSDHHYHSRNEDKVKKSYFFVYCSSASCKQLVCGKLRVICDKCRDGTIIVDRDPNQWNDVLIPGMITGICQSEQCNGTVAKFYFKCASVTHEHDNTDGTNCVPLYLIRHNSIDVSCLACTDIKDTVLVFACSSAHVICLDCFKDYCRSRLNDRKFVIDSEIGYSLGCAVGCAQSLIKETHHFRLMGEEAYEKYQTFAAEECVLHAGGVLCPQIKCGAGILIENRLDVNDDCRRISCGSCGYIFCRKCLQGYHIGDCLSDESETGLLGTSLSINKSLNASIHKANTSKWNDQMSRNAIRELTKPCPKCRTPTERDGGCMHMVCSRSQCGFNWCWVCQTEWNRECMASHWFG